MYKKLKSIMLGKSGEHEVMWDVKNAPNGHIALIGESGSGKSVMAQKLMLELVKQGATILVLDQHGSLSEDQIFDPIKEEFNIYRNDTYAYQDGIPCKLFEPIRYADGMVESKNVTAGAITDVLSRTFKLRAELKSSLRMVIRQMIEEDSYKERGMNALKETLINCGTKKTSEIAEQLYSLFEHNVFVDGDSMLLEGKINIVHLSRLSLIAQETISELVLSYVWRLGNAEMFKKKDFFCFVDECQNMESGKKSPLALMISEGRRMGINLILATQMILQGTTNAVQQRIAQCSLILYFRPASNRIALTAKMVSLNDKDRWTIVLNSLKIGEFIATGNLLVGNREVCYPIKVTSYEGKEYEPCESDSVKSKNFAVNGASER